MNLERLQQLIRTYFIPAIFILVVVVLGSWIFIFRDKPAEEKFGKLPDVEIKSVVWDLIKIQSSADRLKIEKPPKTLPVYLKSDPVNINAIAKKLGFAKTAKKSGKNIDWREGQKTLNFYTSTLIFSYLFKGSIPDGELTEKESVVKAQQILSDLSLVDANTQLKNTKVDRLLIAGRTHPESVGEGKSFDVYAITFVVDLNGYKLLYESGTNHLIYVWVDKRGGLRKLSASTESYRTADKSTYNIKNLGQVKDDLEKGLGKIVSTDSIFPTRVENVIVDYYKANIGYLAISKDKYIRPVYLINGFAETGKFQKSSVKAILPAVQLKD